MSEKEKNKNKVMFLFGAGISIPIGIPAMKGIYQSFMNRKESGISDSDKKISQFFVDNMEVEEDLEEFLLAANSIIEFEDSKMKKFIDKSISTSNSAPKIRDYNRRLSVRIQDVKNVKASILNFLSIICFKFDRDLAKKINSGFVKTVSDLRYPVFSTNYDFAFEYVATEEGVELNDNFTQKRQRYLWNEKISFPDKDGFKLIKLHGSVIWYSDHSGVIEKIYSSTSLNPEGKEVDKIVIVPTRFKDIYAQHFFALYSQFLSSLNEAEVLVIAGHSLRDDYLRAGIIERKRKGGFQIIVIDPHYPIEIKKALPHCRSGTIGDIIHIPYKWEEFSDELSNILLNSSPEAIVKNCVNILNKEKRAKNKIKIKGNIGALISGQKKKLSVQVNVYLSPKEKPAKLRAWLEASYKGPNNENKNEILASFIETKEIDLGDGLSGLVTSTEVIEIKIPKYQPWLDSKCDVKLVVALLKENINKPSVSTGTGSIAQDYKLLEYKGG